MSNVELRFTTRLSLSIKECQNKNRRNTVAAARRSKKKILKNERESGEVT